MIFIHGRKKSLDSGFFLTKFILDILATETLAPDPEWDGNRERSGCGSGSGCEFIPVPHWSFLSVGKVFSRLYYLIEQIMLMEGPQYEVQLAQTHKLNLSQSRRIKTHHRLAESLGRAQRRNTQRQDTTQLIRVLSQAINPDRTNSALLTRSSVRNNRLRLAVFFKVPINSPAKLWTLFA